MNDLFSEDSGATFSRDRRYRYRLWRFWDRSKPLLNMCMLNPSGANESDGDNTVDRCIERARRLGMGALIVTNAYGLVSTDPKGLKAVSDPVGLRNDAHLLEVAIAVKASGGMVICGWGVHISAERQKDVLRLFMHKANITPHALVFTKGGNPGHPLYLTYDIGPMQITDPNFCRGCGFEIAGDSLACGECMCEDDCAPD